ncbi:MAG: IclR family transcriptional regulator [Ilumatobacteraceae bacterium]
MSTVQSIERAFAVLRTLSAGPAGVTDIAERISLPKSTVSRLLSTLEELGAVEQVSAGGHYRIGWAMIELSDAARPGRSLVSLARPLLIELNRQTGAAVGLSIPDGTDMLYLDQVTPDSELQVRDWTGHRIPMHAVPSGQVVLARDDQLAEQVMAAPLQAFTRHTITEPRRLRERLSAVRAAGYAIAVEEYADGLNSVAAPVHNAAGRVVAALHVYGLPVDVPGDRDVDDLGRLVRQTADRLRID